MHGKPFSLSTKVVICDEQGRCLLLKRSAASKANAGKWDFPGGKLENGEDFHAGLLREVAEETGLEVAIRNVAGTAASESPTRRIAYVIFEADRLSGEVRLSDEHDAYLWVSKDELPKADLCPQFRRFALDFSKKG